MTDIDTEELEIEPGVGAAEIAGGSRSLLKEIADRRESREDFLTMDIPSWGGELQARYQVLERDDIEKMVRRIRSRASNTNGQQPTGVDADADFLVKACIGIDAVDTDSDYREQVATGYTVEFAKLLDPKDKYTGEPLPLPTPRHVVNYLCGFNSIALGAHAARVARWMQDTSKSVEDPQ
jgi:hypothetical protein